ncbi:MULTISPECIES: tetratricopeptide repeat protein [Shewanella]|uniref:Tetratricopeptide repeat protein n=1 Tax=Shewanella fodinae TaxID=552357 RepID=A0A4R2FJQ7_9GAMM|nr:MULTISPECIES: hypothetical protein [Shewanella]MBO1271753.1 hypothetical protein [Shewanella sp. 4t3-1-2LB]TCN82813.1 hypothetical protein EDC91_11732 [Shewanella fodinae]
MSPFLKPLLIALAISGLYLPSVMANVGTVSVQQLISSESINPMMLDSLYQQSITSKGGVVTLQQQLQQLAASSTRGADKARATLLAGAIAWRQGDIAQARTLLTAAVAIKKDPLSLSWLARLQEASANKRGALDSYRQLLALLTDDAAKMQIRLRMALLADDPKVLQQYAEQYPQQQFAVAQVLAINGQPLKALQLAAKFDGAPTAAQSLQSADWALSAQQYDQAAKFAWLAYKTATETSDKRYALSLFTEAYRLAGKLTQAVTVLSRYVDDKIVQQLRVDLLLELGRYEDALAVISKSNDPELKSLEVQILALTDSSDKLIQFYKNQIQRQPHEVRFYNGLATELVNQGQLSAARAVYHQLAENNAKDLTVLLDAAKRMIAMGMTNDAIKMIQQYSTDAAAQIQVQLFLFETYLSSGDTQAAAAILQKLSAQLAPSSNTRIALADNYEQLQQPDKALSILQTFERAGGQLSYDLQLHVAALENRLGQPKQAFERWQRLWQQATLPARKNFLENLLITAAQKQGTLDSLKAELEGRLRQQSASRNDVNLLVGIYLAQAQSSQAESAINQFAKQQGITEIDRLQQLATLYGREKAYNKLNTIWAQLAQVDTANARLYWQQITLNSLRNNAFDSTTLRKGQTPQQQRLEQVQLLLGKLQENGEQIDHEFSAGLYAMAGLPTQAIDEYQAAFAQQPGKSDSLLQLVELLKKQQQIEKATNLLQYQMEFASNDNTFQNAVDGMLNLYSGNNSEVSDSVQLYIKQSLSWLKRRLFEQLISGFEPTRTLLVLEELLQTEGEFDAAEQVSRLLLALSATQRPALLRSMVSQFSGAANDGTSVGPAIGNIQKKLLYSRRLLALRQEFPPSLYNDLAKSLLAAGDLLGAERAFSMMSDIPGIINVQQQKGDAYAFEGYDQRALTFYRQALVVDQSNYELLIKVAVLDQQYGNLSIANHWYWVGLKHLLDQLPLFQANSQPNRFSDLSKYFPSLAEGFLMTLQADAALRTTRRQELQQWFAEVVDQTRPQVTTNTQFSDYPRLESITALLRRFSAVSGDFTVAKAADAELDPLFAQDGAFRSQRQDFWWHQLGIASQDQSSEKTLKVSRWPMQLLLKQAEFEDNFPLQLNLAVQQQRWDDVARLARMVVDASKRVAVTQADYVLQLQYFPLLDLTSSHMPSAEFTQKIWPVLMDVANPELVCFQLLRFQPEQFNTIEAKLGHPLLTDVQFRQLAIKHSSEFAPQGMEYSGNELSYKHRLFITLSTDDLLVLYETLRQDAEHLGRSVPLQDEVLNYLLQHPLTERQQDVLKTQLLASLSDAFNGKQTAADIVARLMLLDVAPDNQTVVLFTAAQVVALHPEADLLVSFLNQFFTGEKAQAFASLIKLHQDVAKGLGYNFTTDIVARYLPGQRRKYIENFLAKNTATDQEIELFYQEIVNFERNDSLLSAELAHLRQLRPDEPLYFSAQLKLLWRQSDYRQFTQLLSDWLSKNPDTDSEYLLYFVDRLQQPQSQNTVMGSKIESIDTLVSWLNKSMMQNVGSVGLTTLYSEVFNKYAEKFADDPLVEQFHQRPGSRRTTPSDGSVLFDLHHLVEVYHKDSAQAIAVLGTLWRNSMPGVKQFDGSPLDREQLLYRRFDSNGDLNDVTPPPLPEQLLASPRRDDLLQMFSQYPKATEMFEQWLLAMADDERPQTQRLYDLLVTGWSKQHTLEQHLSQLMTVLRQGQMTLHQLQTLTTILVLTDTPLNVEQVEQLQQVVQQFPLMSAHTRFQLAQIFARAKRVDVASAYIEALAWQLNYRPFTPQSRIVQSRPDALSQFDLVNAMARWSDKAAAKQQLQYLFTLVANFVAHDRQSQALWYSFVLNAAAIVSPADPQSMPEVVEALKQLNNTQSATLKLAGARFYLSLSENNKAFALLRSAFTPQALKGDWQPYNRELNELSQKLFGNRSAMSDNEHLLPWIEDVIQQANTDWIISSATTLANTTESAETNSELLVNASLLLAQRLLAMDKAALASTLLEHIAEQLPISAKEYKQLLITAKERWLAAPRSGSNSLK